MIDWEKNAFRVTDSTLTFFVFPTLSTNKQQQQQQCLFWAHLRHIIERDDTSDFSLSGSKVFSTSNLVPVVISFHRFQWCPSCSTLISFQKWSRPGRRTCSSHFLSDRHKISWTWSFFSSLFFFTNPEIHCSFNFNVPLKLAFYYL
jgi:hypothetical protein